MLRAIRRDERRDTFAAFFILFGILNAHSVLETARDALFLSKIPAEQLPWVYLGIAATSLAIVQLQSRMKRRAHQRTQRRVLAAWLIGAGLTTCALWAVLGAMGTAGLYVLYIWSGVMATLVLVHYWILLGDIFSVTQAKRLFPLIGAGSVLGAISGSALAAAIASFADAQVLVLVGGLLLPISAVATIFLEPRSASSSPDTGPRPSLLGDLRYLLQRPYARQLGMLVLVSTATLTVADYVFKSAVAAEFSDPAELATFLASVYLGLNALSLLSQLFLVNWVVRTMTVIGGLALLPAALVAGGAAFAVIGGLVGALIIKGGDGALRYSLHKTGIELLYVPLSEEARRRVKALVDVIVQRGGQALASVGLLLAAAASVDLRWLAVVLCLLAAAWLLIVLRLRTHYLDLFRGVLRSGSVDTLDGFPELDLASFETLIATLDSDDDAQVIAALDVLGREHRQHLVPSLLLYHPSPAVVIHALSQFTEARRTNALRAIDHLVEHGVPSVRAAAVAARSVLGPDERALRMRLSMDDSDAVRTTIMVNLIAMGAIVGSDARDAVAAIITDGSVEARVALASAISTRKAAGFDEDLRRLAHAAELDVQLAALTAMGKLDDTSFLPDLVQLLGRPGTRTAAARALMDHGVDGLRALERGFTDPALDDMARWQLPQAVARFDPDAAVTVLTHQLDTAADGMLRYRIIRALEALVRNDPTLPIDRGVLQRLVEKNVSRAYRYIDRIRVLSTDATATPERKTPGHDLLVVVLRDKQDLAVNRMLRLLGLMHPHEQFASIIRSLARGDRRGRASATELLENLLTPPLRAAVLALVDDRPSDERLAAAGVFHEPLEVDYDTLVADLLDSNSRVVRAAAIHHAGELRLGGVRPRLEQLAEEDALAHDVALALQRLAAGPAREALNAG